MVVVSNTELIFTIEPELKGIENMLRDQQNAALTEQDGLIRIRLYSWKPYCVSLGANQETSQINMKKAEEFGYDIVIRPTGGRAVLHAEEITYSITMQILNRNIHETYALINQAVKKGLENYGVQGLDFSRANPDFKSEYKTIDSASCFNASALNELTLNGRKIVGSAQRRYNTTLLQHGSILLGQEHLKLLDCLLAYENNLSQLEKAKEKLFSRTATVQQGIEKGRQIEFMELASAIKNGFQDIFLVG